MTHSSIILKLAQTFLVVNMTRVGAHYSHWFLHRKLHDENTDLSQIYLTAAAEPPYKKYQIKFLNRE